MIIGVSSFFWIIGVSSFFCEKRTDTDYSRDGTQLVSGSGDSTVRTWDTLPGKERVRLAKTPAGTGDAPADRKNQ